MLLNAVLQHPQTQAAAWIVEAAPGRPLSRSRSTRRETMTQRTFRLSRPAVALAALTLLDPESETYALDVVSVVEAVLDSGRAAEQLQRWVSATRTEGQGA